MNSKNSTKSSVKKASAKTADLFPYDQFPFRISYKDGNDTRIAWFMHEEHLLKHINRHHLDPAKCKINARDVDISAPKQTKRKKKQKLFSSLEDFFA